jgi:diacylglycerol kinase (ATP)
LNAVAQGLLGSSTGLGIVPVGSGNGYARSLGIPLRPKEAMLLALTATPRAMDVGYLNAHLFLGTAGIGFDARVAHAFDRSKGRGMRNYLRIVLRDILQAAPMRVSLRANSSATEHDVLMLVFCNTREFGNGAIISPASRPDDGLAELRLVSKPAKRELLKAFWDVYTGRSDRSSLVRSVITDQAWVKQEGTLAHVDGEPVEVGHEVHFKLLPKALWVAA